MALTLRGNGQITSDNYTIDSDGDVTVGGTLGVTGDATFDTSTLKVDATNNRVGIGTATPSKVLDITQSTSDDNANVKLTYAGGDGNRSGFILNNTHTGGREYGIYAGNNSTGGGLGNSLGISDNTASTAYRLLISSEGAVTMPYQPSFGAYQASANYNVAAGTHKMIIDGVRWNEGSHYSTANSKFTAPINGVYHFSAHVNRYSVADDYFFTIQFYVNGSSHTMGSRLYSRGGTDLVASMSHTIKLTANDYVEVYTYSNDTSSGFSQGGTWNTFSGFLVG